MEKNYKWSPSPISPRGLYKQCDGKKKLPKLIYVNEGFQGVEDMSSFSAGEVILLTNVLRHTRVVMKSEKKEFFSFPLGSTHKFDVLSKDGEPKELPGLGRGPYTLTGISNKKDQSMLGLKLRLAGRGELTSSNVPQKNNAHVNKFTVVRCVAEPFFVGFSVSISSTGMEETIGESALPLPLYIPIQLTVGVGVVGGSLTVFADKLRAMAQEKQNVALKWTANREGVLMYGEDVKENSQYESLQPRRVIFYPDYEKVNKGEPLVSDLYSEIPSAIPRNRSSTSDRYVTVKQTAQHAANAGNADLKTFEPGQVTTNSSAAGATRKTPPLIPDKTFEHLTEPVPDYKAFRELPPVPSDENDVLEKPTVPLQAGATEYIEIPETLSGLSVGEVTLLLRHWNLSHHIKQFEEQQIDGDLLLELTEPELINDLAFTVFEAKKLVLFAQKPRRPGYKPKSTNL